ncbi:hypothetical protein, partial [Pseudomonas aeruginosa]
LLRQLGMVDNSVGGEISSARAFTLAANTLNNQGGRLISSEALTLRIAKTLDNSLKGQVLATDGLAVVEHVGAKVQAPLADQLAALLEQRTDRRIQHASGGDTALVAVAHLVGYKLQAAFTHQAALF